MIEINDKATIERGFMTRAALACYGDFRYYILGVELAFNCVVDSGPILLVDLDDLLLQLLECNLV